MRRHLSVCSFFVYRDTNAQYKHVNIETIENEKVSHEADYFLKVQNAHCWFCKFWWRIHTVQNPRPGQVPVRNELYETGMKRSQ